MDVGRHGWSKVKIYTKNLEINQKGSRSARSKEGMCLEKTKVVATLASKGGEEAAKHGTNVNGR
jgi:hypothetical protein